jgi:type I restriction enzyme S subunit
MKTMKLTKYKLGELLDVTRGASLSGEYFATQGDYMRLTCGNFDYQNNCFKSNTSKDNLYYTGNFNQEYLMEKDDIITPLTEQAVGLLGSTAWVPESGKYIQSQDVAKITPNKKLLDKKFCYYLISSKVVKQQLSAAAQQTKIRHTSPDKIKDCTVWIPSLEEQTKVGQFLYDIDSKIALNRQINDNLEAMARQLYDYWFVQFDFPDENGKPYKSSGRKMVWNKEIKRAIPFGWEISPLSELLEVNDARRIPLSNKQRAERQGIYPYYGATGIMDYVDNFLFDEDLLLLAEDGSTSDGNGHPIVQYIWGKNWVNNHAHILKPKSVGQLYYYYFVLKQIPVALIETGSIQRKISQQNLLSYKVAVPSKNLIQAYSNVANVLQEQRKKNSDEIVSLTKQRNTLLPLLMNGQATVNYHLSDD